MITAPPFPVRQVVHAGTALRLELLDHDVLRLVLTRPQARNAINAAMLAEFEVFDEVGGPVDDARLLLIQGEGEIFCAGADLADMRSRGADVPVDNLENARRLGRLFTRFAAYPVPVVCCVQGGAFGGGLGIAACSDFVLAQADAVFAMPEVRLGLVPGVIGPYVVRKLGAVHAAPLMLSGARVSAQEALRAGLVHRIVEPAEAGGAVLTEVLTAFLQGGPQASRRTKRLLELLSPLPGPEVLEASAHAIAEARSSAEAQAGLQARMARRPAPWAEGFA